MVPLVYRQHHIIVININNSKAFQQFLSTFPPFVSILESVLKHSALGEANKNISASWRLSFILEEKLSVFIFISLQEFIKSETFDFEILFLGLHNYFSEAFKFNVDYSGFFFFKKDKTLFIQKKDVVTVSLKKKCLHYFLRLLAHFVLKTDSRVPPKYLFTLQWGTYTVKSYWNWNVLL